MGMERFFWPVTWITVSRGRLKWRRVSSVERSSSAVLVSSCQHCCIQIAKLRSGFLRLHSDVLEDGKIENHKAKLFLSAFEWIRSSLNRTKLEKNPQHFFSAWPNAAKGCKDLSSLKL